MSYCTVSELSAVTGTDLSDAILGHIIALADLEISAVLRANGISSSNTNDLKVASLKLSIAGVITRHRMDGTMPDQLSVGQMSIGNNADAAIQELRSDAYTILRGVIASNRSWRNIVRKVNR